MGRAADARLEQQPRATPRPSTRPRASAARSRTTARRSRSGGTPRPARPLPRRHRATGPTSTSAKNSATVGSPNAATDSQRARSRSPGATSTRAHARASRSPPPGPRLNTPGGQAPDALERVDMTGRTGAGIFVAYLQGTNAFHSRAAVWRVGAAKPFVLSPARRALPRRDPRARRAAVGVLGADTVQSGESSRAAATRRRPPSAPRCDQAARQRLDPSVFSLEGEGTAPGGMLDLLALVQRRDAAIRSRTTTSASGPASRCWRRRSATGRCGSRRATPARSSRPPSISPARRPRPAPTAWWRCRRSRAGQAVRRGHATAITRPRAR